MNRARMDERRGSETRWSWRVLSAVQLGCLVTVVVAGRAVLAPAAHPPGAPGAGEISPPDALSPGRALETGEQGALLPGARRTAIRPEGDEPVRSARTVRAVPAHAAIARDASSLKESEHYEAWRARLASDGEAFAREADLALFADGPDNRKVALLRAACDAGHPRAAELLATAVERLPDTSRPHAGSVPRFALTRLAELAARDPGARALLGRIAWSERAEVPPALRAQAAGELARLASGAELGLVLARLELETDASVQASAIASLARNPEAQNLAPVITRAGDPAFALASEHDSKEE